jgi:hypothetical protein
MRTRDSVMAYARACLEQRPGLGRDELQALLEARFLGGTAPTGLTVSQKMSVANDLDPRDWFRGFPHTTLRRLKGLLLGWQEAEDVSAIIKGAVNALDVPRTP